MSTLTIHHGEAKFHLGIGQEYAGISAIDVAFLQHLWLCRPQWASIMELGTSSGATALLLGLLAKTRGGTLVTVDNSDIRPQAVHTAWLDNMIFLHGDLFVDDALTGPLATFIADRSAGGWTLICDGGNKIEELRRYGPLVAVGDGVLVHDFANSYEPHTVNEQRCAPIMDQPGWRRLEWRVAREWDTGFRAWERVA